MSEEEQQFLDNLSKETRKSIELFNEYIIRCRRFVPLIQLFQMSILCYQAALFFYGSFEKGISLLITDVFFISLILFFRAFVFSYSKRMTAYIHLFFFNGTIDMKKLDEDFPRMFQRALFQCKMGSSITATNAQLVHRIVYSVIYHILDNGCYFTYNHHIEKRERRLTNLSIEELTEYLEKRKSGIKLIEELGMNEELTEKWKNALDSDDISSESLDIITFCEAVSRKIVEKSS
jgi:hypothetical protein